MSDFYLVTQQYASNPTRWSWEIKRHSSPMGIRLYGEGYQSQAAAEFAGNRELKEFVAQMARRERNDR
jgi:hypothetical protein